MERKLKILLLEDIEEDAGLITWSLEKSGLAFESKRVDKREDFIDSLRHFQPDVILSDHSLPQFNSMEALRICRWADIRAPFILVTGTVSEEFAVACLKQGADDYLLKGNLTRLPAAIKGALSQRELKAKQKVIELELRLQNEELTKINQELDNFVYSVSHNLRAPLATVLGLLNLAKVESLHKIEWQQLIEMMGASLMKLDVTLNEILDYSRNARNEVISNEINFKALVDELLDKLKYIDGFDRIEKKFEIQGDYPFFTDSYRLKVIMSNLMANAIRFQDENKGTCYMLIRVATELDKTFIFFEDNGVGIRPELAEKVFDMFFRGSVKSEGAGLGLYIVREMVNKLKGKIQLESSYGENTKITLELPNLVYEKVAI